jgi:hypothetical protein
VLSADLASQSGETDLLAGSIRAASEFQAENAGLDEEMHARNFVAADAAGL